MEKTLYTLIIFSENMAGVLNQFTNVLTRRQLNIESLNVSASGVDNIHRYTITCWSDESTIQKVTKQIEKKIDVIQANYFTNEDIFIMESALFKVSTSKLVNDRGISKAIRLHDGKIVEVNATYAIVSQEGLPAEVSELYQKLQASGCLLQFVRSGAIAVTKSRREELNKLFEVVTTNETSFFRNPPQLKVFQEYVLGEVIAACRQSGKKRIRIWSAGCSTGEEPYTLAIILHEVLKSEIASWDIKITANDLSEAVLTAARRGVYNEYALRTTPPEIIRTYFTKEGTTYKINQPLKRLVSFGQINLSDRDQLRRVEKSQIVFCRNVIIYFDDEMKRKVIGAFYDNLEPNGMLLIGHSESLHNISRAFKPEHHTGTIVYRKLG